VTIEDQLYLDDLDLSATFGEDVGGMFEWVGQVSDGTIDIDFARVLENPQINGIEILQVTSQPPSITSPATFSISENGTAVGTVTATDPESDIITFAIAGGADASLFSIDPTTGDLSFVSAPDFELPTDTGADNIYDVQVSAADATNTVTQDIVVTVNDNPNEGDPNAVGAGELVVMKFGSSVQDSNFSKNSFRLENKGDKVIVEAVLDVSGALYPDSVFDPFGLGGDSIAKELTIDTDGGTGAITPTAASYIGAGGADGYKWRLPTWRRSSFFRGYGSEFDCRHHKDHPR